MEMSRYVTALNLRSPFTPHPSAPSSPTPLWLEQDGTDKMFKSFPKKRNQIWMHDRTYYTRVEEAKQCSDEEWASSRYQQVDAIFINTH